jgi:hypothetical protein
MRIAAGFRRVGLRILFAGPAVALMILPLPGAFLREVSAPPASADIQFGGRLGLDLCGGFASLAAGDLNLMEDYFHGMDRFLFDDQLDSLLDRGILADWSRTEEGRRDPLKFAASLGVRGRYRLGRFVYLSLGFTFLGGKERGDYRLEYTENYAGGGREIEDKSYHPRLLSVWGAAPMLGVHFEKPIYQSVTAGFYLAGGPLFAGCRTIFDWSYRWRIRTGENLKLIYQYEGRFEQEGRGTGAALELGIRIGSPLTAGMDFFCEGGYAMLIVPKVTGKGAEILEDGVREWEGRWGVYAVDLAAPWGTAAFEVPTGLEASGSGAVRLRDFKLDLSGFMLRMGLSFRF